MSRTAQRHFFRWRAVGLLSLALCSGMQTQAGTLAVAVQQRDGKPLGGAVVTADAEAPRLPSAAPVHAIVDQVDLAFEPDVTVIPVGSAVSFPNSDAVSHQVYSFSSARRFQLPLYRGKPYPPVVFDQPGVVTLGCNIHDNMLAYVLVTAAPFFGRTDAKGEWSALNVPSGTYRVHVWHPLINERPDTLEKVVEVGGTDRPSEVALRLAHEMRPAPLKGRPHSWDY